jgi:hypothetical protein
MERRNRLRISTKIYHSARQHFQHGLPLPLSGASLSRSQRLPSCQEKLQKKLLRKTQIQLAQVFGFLTNGQRISGSFEIF